jgi:hypothetical protein
MHRPFRTLVQAATAPTRARTRHRNPKSHRRASVRHSAASPLLFGLCRASPCHKEAVKAFLLFFHFRSLTLVAGLCRTPPSAPSSRLPYLFCLCSRNSLRWARRCPRYLPVLSVRSAVAHRPWFMSDEIFRRRWWQLPCPVLFRPAGISPSLLIWTAQHLINGPNCSISLRGCFVKETLASWNLTCHPSPDLNFKFYLF